MGREGRTSPRHTTTVCAREREIQRIARVFSAKERERERDTKKEREREIQRIARVFCSKPQPLTCAGFVGQEEGLFKANAVNEVDAGGGEEEGAEAATLCVVCV